MSMQSLSTNTTELHLPAAVTADICDANPAAKVLMTSFTKFGGRERCSGSVEIVSTRYDNSLVKKALSEPGGGRILLVDNEGCLTCAMIGGDLAVRAAENGWAGIIVNGAVRDSYELKDVPIAVYAIATCPRRSVNRGRGSRNTPVRVGGERICAGDFLVADSDGVVVIAS